jgi:biotin carboxyl carrier protein
MRYFATIQGHKDSVPIDVEPLGQSRYRVTLLGETHEIDALAFEHGTVSILLEGNSYSAEIDEAGDDVFVSLRGYQTRIDVVDERRKRLRAGATEFSAEGRQLISAPMPGKVVKVLVKVGDEVQAGQGLVVVEAMKMENELKSPKAGKVVELFAKEGSTVENNAKLVVVE